MANIRHALNCPRVHCKMEARSLIQASAVDRSGSCPDCRRYSGGAVVKPGHTDTLRLDLTLKRMDNVGIVIDYLACNLGR